MYDTLLRLNKNQVVKTNGYVYDLDHNRLKPIESDPTEFSLLTSFQKTFVLRARWIRDTTARLQKWSDTNIGDFEVLIRLCEKRGIISEETSFRYLNWYRLQLDQPPLPARKTSAEFVRSQDQVSYYSERALGRQLSKEEVKRSFDPWDPSRYKDIFEEINGTVGGGIPIDKNAIREKRDYYGFRIDQFAMAIGLSIEEVLDCENESTRTSIRTLEHVAVHLGMDERFPTKR